MIILCVMAFQPAFSQTSSFRLRTADSLFLAKRYTQSFEHYEEILKQKQYTHAMLLKMAFIQEGLMHVGQAMYYLNLYYLATNDKLVLEKMDELATKFSLEGYETSDRDKFLSFYHDYHRYISMSLAAVMILLLSIAFYSTSKLKKRPVTSFILISLVSAILVVHLYFGENISSGIVTSPATYVMNGPSAGASVVEVIEDGHRVEILGHNDVWLKIRWEGNIAYIKENSLQPIRL